MRPNPATNLAYDTEALWQQDRDHIIHPWIDLGTASPPTSDVVMKVPIAGGTSTTLATSVSNAIQHRIAVDANNVYWTDQPGSAAGGVYRYPQAGGVAVPLAVGIPWAGGVVSDGNYAYFTNLGACPGDGGSCGGSVYRVPTDGGALVALVPSEPNPTGLARDSTHLYWTNTLAGSTIIAMPLGGGAETTLASGQGGPKRLAVDATNAYWTNNLSNSVVTVPLTGGAPVTLATGQVAAFAIAVDSTAVYWTTDTNPGTIVKVAKP